MLRIRVRPAAGAGSLQGNGRRGKARRQAASVPPDPFANGNDRTMTEMLRFLRRPAGRAGLALAAAMTLTACAADINPRGNEPSPELLAQIEPGRQGRNEVRALLGTPSTTSAFGDETWYYISAMTAQWAYRATDERERQVVAISFDDRGVVSEVRRMDQSAGREVKVVERETPTPGRDETILQQLLGNVGRFSKTE